MAELQKNIRRVGGELVSARQPYGRRLLLPSEVELCKTLGLCEDEYWYFVDQTAAYNGKRKEGYELIPDIRAGEALIVEGVLTVWGQIAVSVALTAVGYLLTPKPKPLESGETIKGADSIGSKRFAPQFAFNSLQELANIGDVIPLVFANRDNANNFGGIRVNGQLLWSQLLSLGKLQQLKAIVLFSSGEIDEATRPDFEGYAIGDLLLSSYSHKKLDLFFKSNPDTETENRIGVDHQYDESGILGMDHQYPDDIFAARWPVNSIDPPLHPFSGTRNPTTQAVFGAYSPMPNANVVKLSYELNQYVRKTSNDAKRAVATKQKKTNTFWPTRAGFRMGDLTTEGNTLVYRILKSSQKMVQGYEDGFEPHGVEDVVSMIRGIRENTDSNLAVGETYLVGDAIATCDRVVTMSGEEGVPWRPTTFLNGEEMYAGIERRYVFKVDEVGTDYAAIGTPLIHPNLDEHAEQPKYLAQGAVDINDVKIKVHQDMSDHSLIYGFAYRNPIIQRVALGTITNSRACSMTEIGLKSKVFGSIRGANLNSKPSEAELSKMFDDKVNFQLGTIDHFLKRFSFFYLQIREAGTNKDWETLNNTGIDNHSNLFCIRGNSPEFQYNYIRINHPSLLSQYEFRFKPYPGNNIPIKHLKQKVNLLNATVTNKGQREQTFSASISTGTCTVSFAGQEDFVLERNELCNTEWKLSYNTGDGSNLYNSGPVTSLGTNHTGVNDTDLTIGNNVIINQVSSYTPTYEYEYEVKEDHKDITLVSLNFDYFEDGGSTWAWVAYKNGVEVGHVETAPNTPSTDISIAGSDGNIHKPDIHPYELLHPEDNTIPVHYYKVDSSPNIITTGHI